jgi:hypothetical protein
VNKTDPLRGQSVQHSIIANIQEQIRKGTYKIEIAPSDLVDFGGPLNSILSNPTIQTNCIRISNRQMDKARQTTSIK